MMNDGKLVASRMARPMGQSLTGTSTLARFSSKTTQKLRSSDPLQHNQQHSAKRPYRNRTETTQIPCSFIQYLCKQQL
jgi:hypothetical protein